MFIGVMTLVHKTHTFSVIYLIGDLVTAYFREVMTSLQHYTDTTVSMRILAARV